MITIRDISRTGHIARWHLARTHREQTLAEHLYLVTMYSDEVAKRVLKNYTDSDKLKLLSWGLQHDVPEILTGDIPTPAKRRLQEGYAPGEDPLERLENSIASDDYKQAKKAVEGTKLAYITKIADIIDSIVFIDIEGVTKHTEVIEIKLRKMFDKVVQKAGEAYPDEDWRLATSVLEDVLHGEDGQLSFESDY